MPTKRRKFLKSIGIASGIAGFAGCSSTETDGGGGGGSSDGGDGSSDGSDGSGGSSDGSDGESGGTATEDNSRELADTLRWLGWNHYQVEDIIRPFEEKFGVTVEGAFFDANSSAYNQLKTGGTTEFDVVMADGFWPELYFNEDLVQAINYDRIRYLDKLHDTFRGDQFTLFDVKGSKVAVPNCWGGYGVTYNTEKVDKADQSSIEKLLYNEKYSGHISTSGRQQMNIANTGVMLGYDDPKGAVWDVCEEDKLNAIRDELVKQKDYLVTRYSSTQNLERLFRSGQVWAAPEWSGVYRRLFMDGKPYDHTLLFDEGGLGWVDTWMMTAGVESEAKRNLVYEWINWRLKPENMAIEAKQVGWSPCIDIKGLVSDKLYNALFQDRTEVVTELTQFDTPKCPGKWEETWNEVQQA